MRFLICRKLRCVSYNNFDLAEASLGCQLTSGCDIPLIEFDQARLDMLSVRIGRQGLNYIKPLARAQTDDLKRSIEFRREGLSELSLDHRQTSPKLRVLLKIMAMPAPSNPSSRLT